MLYHPQEACEQFWRLNLLFIPFPAIPRNTAQEMHGRSCVSCAQVNGTCNWFRVKERPAWAGWAGFEAWPAKLKTATKITVGVDQVFGVSQACAGKNSVHMITFDPRIPAPLMIVFILITVHMIAFDPRIPAPLMIVSILITCCLPVNQAPTSQSHRPFLLSPFISPCC